MGTSFSKDRTDKNYDTGNIVIRWLLNRFLRELKSLIKKVHSFSFLGLNIGCGEGDMISYLYHENALGAMVAVDLKREKLAYAKKYHPFCEYLQADVNKLNFKSDAFDYIIATEIIEHLPDPANAMKEISRVAKDKSYFIISVPYEPFFHWGNLLRGKYWNRRGRTPAHLHFWNRREFRAFLSEFVEIEKECRLSTFPWLLYLGRFKAKKNLKQ